MTTGVAFEEALAGGAGVQPLGFRFERHTKANIVISDDINDAIERNAGQITCDGDRATVRTCEVQIDLERLPASVNFATDHLAPYLDVLVEGVVVSVQLGLFHLDVTARNYTPARRKIMAKGSDVAFYLLNAKAASSVTVAAATDILTAIAAEIAAEGLSSSFPAFAAAMPVARLWAPKTSRWDRILEMSKAINFYPPWAGPDGVFTTKPRNDPSTEPSDVTYSTVQAPRLVVSPYETSVALAAVTNRFAALIDEPTRTPAYALRENQDPSSPVSIASTGVTNTDDYSSGIMLDLTTAAAYAAFQLQDLASRAGHAVLTTGIDPRRDAHETYTLNIEDIEVGSLMRQLSWTLPLNIRSRMVHQLASAAAVAISVGS